MTNISKFQYKLLRKINNNKITDYHSLNEEELKCVCYLSMNKFIENRNSHLKYIGGNSLDLSSSSFEITEAGYVEIYRFRSTFYKWWIPVVISTLSLAASIIIPFLVYII